FNLLSNAFKFTQENGSVSVAVVTEQRDGDVLLSIHIRDTGIGIAPDKQEKIFERFFQNEVPETILNQGSGIGLSITQEFVRMHNGRLSVESEVDKGSCFTVQLPLPILDASPEVITDDLPKALPGVSVIDKRGPRFAGKLPVAPADAPTILIVEDNEDFRFYLKDNLRNHYKIVEASDGKEGW